MRRPGGGTPGPELMGAGARFFYAITSKERQFLQAWYGTPTPKIRLASLCLTCRICPASTTTSSRSIPRPTTQASAPIAVQAGRGAMAGSAPSASPGAKVARSTRSTSRCATPTPTISIPPQSPAGSRTTSRPACSFVTFNGGYDWPWLATDLGVAMPPSSQLEEVGVLAALVDENQLKYSLDAICKRHGLPGKDTALLEEACKAGGLQDHQKDSGAILHLAVAGACLRPVWRRRSDQYAVAVRDTHSNHRAGRHPRRPIGSKST